LVDKKKWQGKLPLLCLLLVVGLAFFIHARTRGDYAPEPFTPPAVEPARTPPPAIPAYAPTPEPSPTPTPAPLNLPLPVLPTLPLEGVAQPLTSWRMSGLLTPDGALWTWGRLLPLWTWGQLSPPTLTMEGVVHATLGHGSVLVVHESGALYFWSVLDYSPVQIADNVVYATLLNSEAFFIDAAGTLWQQSLWSDFIERDAPPLHIADNVVTVTGSFNRFYILTADGVLTRVNDRGRGIDRQKVIIMHNIVAVSARNHTLAITADGALYAWGEASRGQIGNGQYGFRLHQEEPVHIMDNVAAVTAAWDNSFAITTCGQLWGWGANDFGQVGIGLAHELYAYPMFVMEGATRVAISDWHAVAVMDDGRVMAWGINEHGEMGRATPSLIQTTPMEILLYQREEVALTTEQVLAAHEAFMAAAAPSDRLEEMHIVHFIGAQHPALVFVERNIFSYCYSGNLFILEYRGGWHQQIFMQFRWAHRDVYIGITTDGQAYMINAFFTHWGGDVYAIIRHYLIRQDDAWRIVLNTVEVSNGTFEIGIYPATEAEFNAATHALGIVAYKFVHENSLLDLLTTIYRLDV